MTYSPGEVRSHFTATIKNWELIYQQIFLKSQLINKCHNPADFNLNLHHHENLKSCISYKLLNTQ